MVPYKPLHMHSILTSVKLIMPPERPVRIQMSQNSNLSMLTVHKINVCNCLFLSLLFLSFPSDFLHWIFLHFLYCVKPDCQLFSKTQVPCYISVTGTKEHWKQRQDLGYHTHTSACSGNTDSCSRQQIPHIQAASAVGQICCPNGQCASSMPDAVGHSG